MIEQTYRGYLLAAHPKRSDPYLRRGAVLIIDHDTTGAIGLQINKSFTNDVSFNTVMQNVGLPNTKDQPLYNGGPEATNRIHVIHSLDWYSQSTVKVTDKIGISNDISVLAAISEGQRFDSAHLHHNLKSQPLSVGIFFARSASVGAVSGQCLARGTPTTSPVPALF